MVSLVATTTPPQQTTPKGYRKRLIQSVASESQRVSQLLAEQAAAAAAAAMAAEAAESGKYGGQDADTGVSPGRETISSSERAATKLVSPQAPPAGDLTKSHSSGDGEQANSSVVPAAAPKRRKKAKSSGGVRVRAPPKKRAKMELAELEKMMREETEEEDEEEDSGLAGTPSAGEALVQAGTPTKESERQKHVELQSQQTTSGRRAKLPYKEGRRARWIKNDRLTHLVIQLSVCALDLPEGDKRHYQCRLCSNEFMVPRRCISHVLTTHKIPEEEVLDNISVRRRDGDDSDPTMCDICGYKSRDGHTYYLHYHKYFKHGVPLPKGWSVYKCDVCGKELFTKFQLKDHKRAHEEKTPFVCEMCGKGFQTRTCLHSHVFHRHNKEKKHSCDKCEKTFKTKTQLHMHIRTHTGERPFACPQCTYRSTTRGNMRMHLVNRHKMAPEVSRDVMQDVKPDTDPAAAARAQQLMAKESQRPPETVITDVFGQPAETKGRTKTRRRKKKESCSTKGSNEKSALPGIACLPEKLGADIESSDMEQFLKTATDDRAVDEDIALRMRMDEEGGFPEVEEQLVSRAYMMLVPAGGGAGAGADDSSKGEDGNNVITLQATGGLPTAGLGLDVPGEVATTLALLPPGLESVFYAHPPSSLPTSATSATTATAIIVPENLMHTFQQQHHPCFYTHHHQQQQQQPFASFTVVGAATTAVHPLTSHDLVMQATTLNPHAVKGDDHLVGVDGGVVDLGGVEVQVVEGGALRQGELALQQVASAGGAVSSSFVQQSIVTCPDPPHAPQVHLYMQHSPISPPAPLSPTPTYDAITPTPAAFKQESDPFHDPLTSVASAAALTDHSQAQQQHYEASLLQVYYQQQQQQQQQQQFYSQNY
ncbi:uncharacterized protein LOC112559130 isoform X2 [Pomacea canaliculata]|uniref:uncharacterized protein LOC112559130 isoform X2 n=1 Tax=Pomacea canaliculata TaxID=400727 RepID=UPI000D731BC2|nr:uncharacterized protein LOC112559130 isoform X2 [Pomacea canaliculata]